ncbi:LysE family translocator [Flavobacteriaceae bacterium]|jgi:threonine/homoserine/homoserine lactone efflux protein|nr:LysE family translocator [Flavobacteriaceae bacterium]
MEQNTLFLFLISSLTLTLLPGPDLLFVVSTSLARGWKKGVLVGLGLCSGLILHTALLVLGVGTFLGRLPEGVRALELLGALYLLFIAYGVWNSSQNSLKSNSKKQGVERLYFTGFIMNLTNPKVSLFFISFFPGFLFSEALSYTLQFLILGGIFFVQALVVFTASAILVSFLGQRLQNFGSQSLWNKVQAAVLMVIALLLIYP